MINNRQNNNRFSGRPFSGGPRPINPKAQGHYSTSRSRTGAPSLRPALNRSNTKTTFQNKTAGLNSKPFPARSGYTRGFTSDNRVMPRNTHTRSSFMPKPSFVPQNRPMTPEKKVETLTEKRPLSPRGLRTKSIPKKTYNKRDIEMRMRVHMPKKTADIIPEAADNIRIIPLGGCEEIGKNMTVVEYRDDIIVLDAGFKFKEEDTPGVDYILPNTKYLEDRKDKIRGVFITHGHLDHIGGIPYIMNRIGNPPIYTRALTSIMVKKRQEEFPHLPPLDIRVIEKEDRITVGKLKIKFFSVTHTIPDAMGVIIETPYGDIVDPGDIKLDHIDGIPSENEEKEYSRFKDANTLLLMMDSTNIENPGFSTPEWLVGKNLEEIIRTINGRLIIGTFASQLERIIKIIESSERLGKKVVVEGRSMKTNIDIALQAGMFKVKPETIITAEEMPNFPPDRIVALVTGAQGDEFAALMRMSNKTHKNFVITPRDTVLLSSSIIPGNEKAVEKLKDNLARQGAKIIHYRSSDVYIHSTGHGNRGELEWIHRHINPRFFMPMHGNFYRLKMHEELAKQTGMPAENVITPDNGSILEIQNNGTKFVRLKEQAPGGMVFVDGFSVGDAQELVMRDRKMLAQDGMFVVVVSINIKTGKLKKSPDLISRGFVYLRESQDLLAEARTIIKKTVEETTHGMNPINFDYVRTNISDNVGRFLFQKTAKRPIVIPVILGV